MKNIFYIATLFLFVISCKKEKDVAPVNQPYIATVQDTLISQGSFISNAHTTTGTVKLYSKNGNKTLSFNNFATDSGPDLRVYLSKTTGNADFVDLGVLKSTSGDFSYQVSSTVNTVDYKYVLIWCEDFSVLFGNTQLQ